MNVKRMIVLAAAAYLTVLCVEVAGQIGRPLPGDPLPGLTGSEFEDFRLGLNDFTDVETAEDGLGPAFNGSSCAVCHTGLDPIGLGMENFNGIGAYRSTYGNGQPIDASGTLPDGTTFNGIVELAGILSAGDRKGEIAACAVKRLMAYALSRPVTAATDAPYVAQVTEQWSAQKYALRSLLQDVVSNDTFRLRRGGY